MGIEVFPVPPSGPSLAEITSAITSNAAPATVTMPAITSSITTNSASSGVTMAAINSAITTNAAPASVTMAAITSAITTNAASSGVTMAAITSAIQANAGSPYAGTITNLGFQNTNGSPSTITFSNLGSYKYLRFYLFGFYRSGGSTNVFMRLNGDSGANYNYAMNWITTSQGSPDFQISFGNSYINIWPTVGVQDTIYAVGEIRNSNSSTIKYVDIEKGYNYNGSSYALMLPGAGMWNSTAAVTSVSFSLGAGTAQSGSLYGVGMWGGS